MCATATKSKAAAIMPPNPPKPSDAKAAKARHAASAPQPLIKKNPPIVDKKRGRDSDFAELDSLFRSVSLALLAVVAPLIVCAQPPVQLTDAAARSRLKHHSHANLLLLMTLKSHPRRTPKFQMLRQKRWMLPRRSSPRPPKNPFTRAEECSPGKLSMACRCFHWLKWYHFCIAVIFLRRALLHLIRASGHQSGLWRHSSLPLRL